MDRERKLALLPGLPPLPKSLSVAAGAVTSTTSSTTHSNTASPLNHAQYSNNDLYLGASTSNASIRVNHRSQRHGSLSSTQESLSDRESIHSRASSTHSSHHHTPTNPNTDGGSTGGGSSDSTTSTLDTQIAILRREMYGLRQLDLSLLSQLWALNESIQGFRVFLQEQEALSPPSPSPTPSDTNSLTSEPEDESFAATQPHRIQPPVMPVLPGGSTTSHASTSSASGTSGSSSAASSMGKHHYRPPPHTPQHNLSVANAPPPTPPTQKNSHPQLPRILQQRMRHAPPPPPPSRPNKPPNKTPIQQRPV